MGACCSLCCPQETVYDPNVDELTVAFTQRREKMNFTQEMFRQGRQEVVRKIVRATQENNFNHLAEGSASPKMWRVPTAYKFVNPTMKQVGPQMPHIWTTNATLYLESANHCACVTHDPMAKPTKKPNPNCQLPASCQDWTKWHAVGARSKNTILFQQPEHNTI